MATNQNQKWEIVLVRPRGRRLGVVEATDQVAAIKKAIEMFKITDAKRINAQRLSDSPR
jgi:hypothetical protein